MTEFYGSHDNSDYLAQTVSNVFISQHNFQYYSNSGFVSSYLSPTSKKVYGIYPAFNTGGLEKTFVYSDLIANYAYGVRLIRKELFFTI